jgi:hypothetical protein
VVLYRSVTATRNAVARWCADLAIVALAIAVAVAFTSHPSEPLGGAFVTHVAKIVAGAALVGTWAVFPVGATHSPNLFRLVGAAIIVGAVVLGILRARHDTGSKYWLTVTAGGFLFAMAAYATYIPAAGYTPVGRGIANRTNILSEVGMATAAYGTVQVLARAAAGRWRATNRSVLAAVLVGLLALGYVATTVQDERAWDGAAHEQGVVLARLGSAVPRPSAGTSVVVFGVPGFRSPGVPVFYAPWDLNGAVQLYWHERRLSAWPVTRGIGVVCGRRMVTLMGPNFVGTHVGYSNLLFVDLRAEHYVRIRTPSACMHWPYRRFGVPVSS